ncbi:MAG: hypothetical protein M3271_00090 [Actinomycetota bacterium]|nr:hypothetical protein [Actinomycetota bacterium]
MHFARVALRGGRGADHEVRPAVVGDVARERRRDPEVVSGDLAVEPYPAGPQPPQPDRLRALLAEE